MVFVSKLVLKIATGGRKVKRRASGEPKGRRSTLTALVAVPAAERLEVRAQLHYKHVAFVFGYT